MIRLIPGIRVDLRLFLSFGMYNKDIHIQQNKAVVKVTIKYHTPAGIITTIAQYNN